MSRLLLPLALSLSLLLSNACSGGGGEGESESPTSAQTGVRLLHGAIDLPPVFSSSSSGTPSSQVRFAERSVYSALDTGAQNLTVQSVGDGAESFTFPISVARGERRSVVIFGTRETFGIRATLLEDFPPPSKPGTAFLRVVHALAGAAALNATVGGVSVPEEIKFGASSAYQSVPAGEIEISASREADGRQVARRTLTVEPKRAYTFFITGEIDYSVFTELLQDR